MSFKKIPIEQRFGPYRKPNDKQIEQYSSIQQKALEFAQLIEKECPESPEKSTALTQLMQVRMSANAAIAIYTEEGQG